MECPTACLSLSWRKRCARLEKTSARSGRRIRGIARCAKASIWAGSRMRCMTALAEPGPVMLPGPARRHRTPGHRLHRALDPDAGIDMHDDGADQNERAHRVHDGSEPDQ